MNDKKNRLFRLSAMALAIAAVGLAGSPAVLAAGLSAANQQSVSGRFDAAGTGAVPVVQHVRVTGRAFNAASGNLGANVAGGNANEQSNDTSMAEVAATGRLATVSAANTQAVGPSGIGLALPQAADAAGLGRRAFEHANGTVALNEAAGVGNEQANATTLLASDALGVEAIGQGTIQEASITGAALDATAALGGDDLNLASGAGDQQASTLTVVGP